MRCVCWRGGEDLRARMGVVSALGGLGRWVVGLALMGEVLWVSGVVVFPWRLDWFGVLDGLMRDGLDFLALNRGILWALVLWRVAVSWGMSVVFVCVGFAFYLQGRMQLEGWGVGLGLRALARRLAVVVLLGWLGLGWRGEVVWAMSEAQRQAYGARVQEVLEAPEVSPYAWQKIRDGADARKGGRFDLDGEDFAVMLRGGLVLGALGVAVWMGGLVWRRWRERRRFGGGALGVGVGGGCGGDA